MKELLIILQEFWTLSGKGELSWLAGCLHRQIHTRECIDVNDSVLARLVVNDDVDAEKRNPESFP